MTTQKQIASLRVRAYQFHYNSLLFEGVHRIKAHKMVCAENPMNWFAGALERAITDFATDSAPYQPWWSEFNHRYLNMVAIMYLTNSATASSDTKTLNQMEHLYKHTYGEILDLLKDVIPLTHPIAAKRLIAMAGLQM